MIARPTCRFGDAQPRQAGISLLELLVASAIAILALGALSSLLDGGAEFARTSDAELDAARSLAAALEQISRDVESSSPNHISIDTSDPVADRLEYELSLPDSSGVVHWGADGVADQQVEVRVDGDRLVRRTLASDGTLVREQTLARDLAVDANARPFTATWTGGALTVTLRVRLPASTGGAVREATTSSYPRNP